MIIRLPQHCILCGAQCAVHYHICNNCYQDLPWIKVHCLLCGLPIHADKNAICGQCINHKLPYDTILAPFYYQQPMIKLISSFKFKHELGMAEFLAQLIFPNLEAYYSSHKIPELILPIPLHSKRLYERGYNQATEMGKHLSKSLDIPLPKNASHRIRYTPSQHTLDKKLRKKNLVGAFTINLDEKIKHVAVLDDVITTGSTTKIFCSELKKNNVATIDVWCVARTILSH